MSLFEITLIAIGLAMDCFAVSIASAAAYGKVNIPRFLRLALFFGLFQGVMPLIGWAAGVSFSKHMMTIDHWVAFIILGFIGGKMILDSLHKHEESCNGRNPFDSFRVLLMLSVATSIDALATGLIFINHEYVLPEAMGIIALGSALFSLLGIWIGLHFGKRFKVNVTLIGGIILVGIGIKILFEHTMA